MGDSISRQVVAKFLDDWLFCLDENCHKQSASDLKMIIKDFKNLPSIQPEPCEDAVSREAVLSMIDTYMNKSVELHYLPTSDGIKKLISILPSARPEIIRCKDCIYQVESWSGIKYCEAHGDHIGKDYDYCSNARRKENGH